MVGEKNQEGRSLLCLCREVDRISRRFMRDVEMVQLKGMLFYWSLTKKIVEVLCMLEVMELMSYYSQNRNENQQMDSLLQSSLMFSAFGGKGLYGMRVHKAVLASGARYSGPTIHFVDEECDTGRILAQTAIRVIANDTPEELARRVLHEEHKLYVEVVAAICEERIKWREDGVPLIQSKENLDEYY